MVTCVSYASDGSAQSATAASPSSSSSSSHPSFSSCAPLSPSQLLWEQAGLEYREAEQAHMEALLLNDDAQQPSALAAGGSPSLDWRALLVGLTARLPLPPLFSQPAFGPSFPSSSLPSAASALRLSRALPSPFSSGLLDPLCESAFSHALGGLLCLLALPLALTGLLAGPLHSSPGSHCPSPSYHSSLWRSLAVFCAAVLLAAVAAGCFERWLEEEAAGWLGGAEAEAGSEAGGAAQAAASSYCQPAHSFALSPSSSAMGAGCSSSNSFSVGCPPHCPCLTTPNGTAVWLPAVSLAGRCVA